MKKQEVVKGYKGYNKDLKCNPSGKLFQYEIGKEYEEPNANVCKNGFHFCENPLDIFRYYEPASSRFTEIEANGIISKESDNSDTKVSCSNIKIGVEISLHSLIEKGVKFIFERTTLTKESTNTKEKLQAVNKENSGAASNSGDSGAASNSGYRGAASNSGYRGAASNSGYSGAASNSGYRGAASNSGDSGAASNSGDRGAASNSGDSGAASNSGDSGAAFTIGNYSSASTDGEKSVAVAVGYSNKAKATIGNWIVLAERNDDYEILYVKSFRVDGKKVKENVFYYLKDGKLVSE